MIQIMNKTESIRPYQTRRQNIDKYEQKKYNDRTHNPVPLLYHIWACAFPIELSKSKD